MNIPKTHTNTTFQNLQKPALIFVLVLLLVGCGAGTHTPSSDNEAPSPDNEAPSAPMSLEGSSLSGDTASLSWSASTDNIGVAGYTIFRDAQEITKISNTSFVDNGLLPNTTYKYTVNAFDSAGNQSDPSSTPLTLKTAGIEEFEFVVFGDFNGGDCARNERVQKAIDAMAAEDVAFFVQTGDLIDGYGTTSCFASDPSEVLQTASCSNGIPNGNVAEMLSAIKNRAAVEGLVSAFYPVIGNHDDNWGSNWYPDQCGQGICEFLAPKIPSDFINHPHGDICSLDRSSSSHSRDFYYSFSYKNSYFIVLKENNDSWTSLSSCNGHPGYSSCSAYCGEPSLYDDPERNKLCYSIEQYDWLRSELESASSQYQHIFVFAHAVLLGSGDGHKEMAGAPRLRAILEKYNVDIFFNGHNHAYERTHPIKGDTIDNSGTVYLTVGSAGGAFNAVATDWFTAASYKDWTSWGGTGFNEKMTTYTKVTISGSSVSAKTRNIHNLTDPVDEFILLKHGSSTLQQSGITATEITTNSGKITWNTSIDSSSLIRYGVSAGNLNLEQSTPDFAKNFSVTLSNLEEHTTYYYQVTSSQGGELVTSDTLQFTTSSASAFLPAFPGAAGFGAVASGGRGGRVIKVTNLNASGAGSLQEALDYNEPRIIVFETSGVISGDIIVRHGDVTIAGQTAPGAGITINGRLSGAYSYDVNNIIIRHIRVRPPLFDPAQDGNSHEYDSIQFSRNSQLIFDHISVAYGMDETFDLYEADDVTVQWSIIQEAADNGPGSDNTYKYALISGPDAHRISVHHNLFAHNENRNPSIANGPADVINNVIYNVRHGFVHHNPASGQFNIIGNYYKQGPNNSLIPFFFDDESGGSDSTLSYYLAQNYIDDPGDYVGMVENIWDSPALHPSFNSLGMPENFRSAQPFDFSNTNGYITISTSLPEDAYDLVLANAGAFPRDFIDTRDISETQSRTGDWGARRPTDLMEGLTTTAVPADSDDDGMPDTWENLNGLDSGLDDHNHIMASGYTAIEEYINELAN